MDKRIKPKAHSVLFLISNYERKEMLLQLIKEIRGFSHDNFIFDYIIFDDKSSYKINDRVVVNNNHRGKKFYWQTFNDMFRYCHQNKHDTYVFIPNDFINYDLERMIYFIKRYRSTLFVMNIINDGRVSCWNRIARVKISADLFRNYFCDCGFITNRVTLQKLGFYVNPININYDKYPSYGSGVGAQLTNRMLKLQIPIYTPAKSLAHHGDHDSLMNPQERKTNKILSV